MSFPSFILGALSAAALMYVAHDNGHLWVDPNAEVIYGKTGLPRNCRAIVADNIEGWRRKDYPTEGVIDSLDRNCGASGYSWGIGAQD